MLFWSVIVSFLIVVACRTFHCIDLPVLLSIQMGVEALPFYRDGSHPFEDATLIMQSVFSVFGSYIDLPKLTTLLTTLTITSGSLSFYYPLYATLKSTFMRRQSLL